jgi:hypothetical protein
MKVEAENEAEAGQHGVLEKRLADQQRETEDRAPRIERDDAPGPLDRGSAAG